ncbi:type VII secretion integral membrane protein EccD [Corynebacterium sp. LK2510]|uniref:type VII secretion integral membrane protein EccD n=1 Tax=Corynebacterium sp. LK2510 TaxID=3110472 RepID=UPI0034CD4E48
MVATSAHHIVHVTLRVDVVSFHRDVDLTLPTSSTLAEVIPALARLIDLPAVHRPWQATTVAGAPLDLNTALHQLKLYDGAVIVLRPQEPTAPPVVRDAAEALAAAAPRAAQVSGLDTAASLAGCAALAAVLFPLAGAATALAVVGGVGVALSMFARSRALFVTAAVSVALACARWVAGEPASWTSSADPAWGVLAGAGTLFLVSVVGAAFSLLDASFTAATTTASALLAVGAVSAWLPSTAAPAAVTVAAVVIVCAAAPGIATRAAGLRIPRIPTAGEELSSADGYQPDVDVRVGRARRVSAGVCIGAALAAAPALLWLGWTGRVWAAVLCVCTLGAVAFHAARHHYPVPRVALSTIAWVAVFACAVAAGRADAPSPVLIAVAILIALAGATAVLWASRIPELEPTTLVWFERAESLALVAALPVAAHIAGVFDMVRGL